METFGAFHVSARPDSTGIMLPPLSAVLGEHVSSLLPLPSIGAESNSAKASVFTQFPSPQFLFPGFLDPSLLSSAVQKEPSEQPVPYIVTVGPISAEQRRKKVDRYKMKREQRVFRKKVEYQGRRAVAERRLRVKGRFVTKEAAEALSGLEDSHNNVTLWRVSRAL